MKEQNEISTVYMLDALDEARTAAAAGEVPVGASVVCGGEIISRAHNLVETRSDASAHAELLALSAAAKKLGTRRLNDCILYVTLEPCAMCMGAIMNFRIAAVVFGAFDPRGRMLCFKVRTVVRDDEYQYSVRWGHSRRRVPKFTDSFFQE